METRYNRTIDTLERLRAESAAAGGPDRKHGNIPL